MKPEKVATLAYKLKVAKQEIEVLKANARVSNTLLVEAKKLLDGSRETRNKALTELFAIKQEQEKRNKP